MMTCDEWRAFAHDYVLGDLSDPARELLDRHAASCAACLGEARALQRADRLLREDPAVTPPPDLSRLALASTPRRRWGELRRVAAAVLVAGAIGAASLSLPDDWKGIP